MPYTGPALTPKLLGLIEETTDQILRWNPDANGNCRAYVRANVHSAVMQTEVLLTADERARQERRLAFRKRAR